MSGPCLPTVAVVGSTGFVGRSVVEALAGRGAAVRPVRAPRLKSTSRNLPALRTELLSGALYQVLAELREALVGCDSVVNAAGLATATGESDELFGANALLPGVLAGAISPGVRFVHVSSAAVQGRRQVLDESTEHAPFSPYSLAKSLGERMLGTRATSFRPTSVHGRQRGMTRALSKLCASPLASVAGHGERPTPQVLAANVADAIAFTVLWQGELPRVVLQPSEGLTTAEVVRLLGDREPHHVPDRLARSVVAHSYRAGLRSPRTAGLARRLEMLWFGQEQIAGWLSDKWSPPADRSAWVELRQ